MPKNILCCGILKPELEFILREQNLKVDNVNFLETALHVDFELLAGSLLSSLRRIGSKDTVLVIGTQCHPEMERMTAQQGVQIVRARNCIEMLLGPQKMAALDAEAKTFYLSPGWLENWRRIFIQGLQWDTVDARLNFGFYDRLLVLDTGVTPINEEQVLEFFDYTQVPVEVMPVDLTNFRQLLEEVLND